MKKRFPFPDELKRSFDPADEQEGSEVKETSEESADAGADKTEE